MSLKKEFFKIFKRIFSPFKRLIEPKNTIPENRFSKKNYGIIERLNNMKPKKEYFDKEEFIKEIIKIYGIQVDYPHKLKDKANGIKTIKEQLKFNQTYYDISYFVSYDKVKIPLYVIYPPNFNKSKRYPCIIIFSGHGSANQAAFDITSYQKGCGMRLSKNGFLVYVMENRGMGKLSYLGNHLRIDAIARITGGTWYGEIITDALYLIENLHLEPNIDVSLIGVAGVSTGGSISMIVASIDERIAVTYIQGFLGSFRSSFGIRGTHCLCGHIPGILNIGDMSDIASFIAPRPVLFVNGSKDSFFFNDAKMAFNKIKTFYKNMGFENNLKFMIPQGVGHEFSVDIALKWFKEKLKIISYHN